MARVQYGMVRAMGMGMRVLELLSDGIREQGGNEEVLRFLTHPRCKNNLTLICRTIAECDWRVPASVMRDLAWKRRSFVGRGLREYIRNLWWSNACIELGIPYTTYSNDPNSGLPAIPPMLLDRFRGRTMEYPLFVEPDRRHVVVNFYTEDNSDPEPGEPIKVERIGQIGIAEARYFDFDK